MIGFHPDFWSALGFVLSVVLPLLVGLVTTRSTSPGLQATLLALFSALTGLGTELAASHAQGAPYDLWAGVLSALAAFVIGVAVHYGFWKPTTIAARAQALGTQDQYDRAA